MSNFIYLFDTNILSDLVRRPAGKVAQRIEAIGEEQVCTSLVVAAELRYGALKKRSDRLTNQLETILSALDILPWKQPADARYAELRTALKRAGKIIGPNDMLIAAHTLALDLILVTANVGEFGYVPDLRIENWLA